MAKKFQLSIPEPCHENWDAMTPVEKGRYCGSCQKQVVDFSMMSDRQVAEFFKKPSTGSVCGRFMTDQLERDIDIPKKRIPWFKYFFQIALPAFLVSIKASAQNIPTYKRIDIKTDPAVKADTVIMPEIVVVGQMPFKPSVNNSLLTSKVAGPVVTVESTIPTTMDIAKKRNLSPVIPVIPVNLSKGFTGIVGWPKVTVVDTAKRTISGVVTDDKGEPVSNASVVIKGTRMGTVTDTQGNFRIQAKTGDILYAAAVGFESAILTVAAGNTISMLLHKELVIGGEVVVVAGGISVSYDRPKKKKESKNVPEIPEVKQADASPFKIFPNPVEAGTNLNIEWKNVEEGYYTMQLLNQSGQSVHQQEIWIDSGAKLLSMDIPRVAAGSYFIVMTNKKTGKRFTEKIIVQ